MTTVDIVIGMLGAGICLSVIRLAVRANRDWPALYKIFLLLFFTVWSGVLWLLRPPSVPAILIPSLALLGGAIAVGFVPIPPPKNRRETKNLLDLIETERSLERFFSSRSGRLFWPLLAALLFSVSLRVWQLAQAGGAG